MTDHRSYVLSGDRSKAEVLEAVRRLPVHDGSKWRVRIERWEPPFTDGQRKLVHALCAAFAEQQTLPSGRVGSPTDWRRCLIALMRNEHQENFGERGMVLMGGHLSGMTRSEASALIEFLYAEGAERGVVFHHEETA